MEALELQSLGARLLQRGLRGRSIEVAAHDARAMAREHQRAALTDAAARTRYDRDFARQPLRQPHSGGLVLAVAAHSQVRLFLVTGEAFELAQP
jgi:hypothetical protein